MEHGETQDALPVPWLLSSPGSCFPSWLEDAAAAAPAHWHPAMVLADAAMRSLDLRPAPAAGSTGGADGGLRALATIGVKYRLAGERAEKDAEQEGVGFDIEGRCDVAAETESAERRGETFGDGSRRSLPRSSSGRGSCSSLSSPDRSPAHSHASTPPCSPQRSLRGANAPPRSPPRSLASPSLAPPLPPRLTSSPPGTPLPPVPPPAATVRCSGTRCGAMLFLALPPEGSPAGARPSGASEPLLIPWGAFVRTDGPRGREEADLEGGEGGLGGGAPGASGGGQDSEASGASVGGRVERGCPADPVGRAPGEGRGRPPATGDVQADAPPTSLSTSSTLASRSLFPLTSAFAVRRSMLVALWPMLVNRLAVPSALALQRAHRNKAHEPQEKARADVAGIDRAEEKAARFPTGLPSRGTGGAVERAAEEGRRGEGARRSEEGLSGASPKSPRPRAPGEGLFVPPSPKRARASVFSGTPDRDASRPAGTSALSRARASPASSSGLGSAPAASPGARTAPAPPSGSRYTPVHLTLQSLPSDLLVYVISYCTALDLIVLSECSRTLRVAARDEVLWRWVLEGTFEYGGCRARAKSGVRSRVGLHSEDEDEEGGDGGEEAERRTDGNEEAGRAAGAGEEGTLEVDSAAENAGGGAERRLAEATAGPSAPSPARRAASTTGSRVRETIRRFEDASAAAAAAEEDADGELATAGASDAPAVAVPSNRGAERQTRPGGSGAAVGLDARDLPPSSSPPRPSSLAPSVLGPPSSPSHHLYRTYARLERCRRQDAAEARVAAWLRGGRRGSLSRRGSGGGGSFSSDSSEGHSVLETLWGWGGADAGLVPTSTSLFELRRPVHMLRAAHRGAATEGTRDATDPLAPLPSRWDHHVEAFPSSLQAMERWRRDAEGVWSHVQVSVAPSESASPSAQVLVVPTEGASPPARAPGAPTGRPASPHSVQLSFGRAPWPASARSAPRRQRSRPEPHSISVSLDGSIAGLSLRDPPLASSIAALGPPFALRSFGGERDDVEEEEEAEWRWRRRQRGA